MPDALVNLTVHARGEMATKLLEAAEELGLSPLVIKTTSEGFRVPVAVHQHLFPSLYEELPPAPSDSPDNLPDGQGVVIDPAADFTDLSDDELDELTDPDKGE